jgi:hypothetical protein
VDRRFHACLSLFLVSTGLLFSSPNAVAAPKDAAATKLADDAINRDYLSANFAEAEKKLRQAIGMCGTTACVPTVVGRLHRDLGVVLIAGLNRRDEGKQELAEAIRADPDVALEKDLTTPEIDQIFKALKAGGLPPPKPTTGAPGAAGELIHSPPPEQRTLTAVPIYVELPDGVTPAKVIARYKPHGTPDWKTLELHRMGNGYGGEAPCMDVGSTTGDFVYYVLATDAAGEVVGTSGTRAAPNKVVIKNEPVNEPPHLPGRPPPSRCREAGDCPPGMPGCGRKTLPTGRGWGATCTTDRECGTDYWCKQGTCESGVRVETDNEPQASGKYCDSSADCDKGERCSPARACERAPEKAKKFWLSLNVGQDFSFIGTQADVCGTSDTLAAQNYACIDKDNYSYNGMPVDSAPGTGNAINGGIDAATTRFLLGAELLVGENVTLGARVGYVRGTAGGRSLAVFHGEGRVAFWFGREPFSRERVRPFLVVAGGLAEVDSKFSVPIIESPLSTAGYPPTQTLTVWRQSGSAFAGGGFGVMIPTGGAGQGVTAEVKCIALFPDSGIAIAPSIGYALGL